jgi:pre-mRNA-processing factor 40
MNGIMEQPLWTQAKTPEGKIYYYNTQTKATQWTKPVELMTPAEVRRV